jgi:hypothetical protein
MSDDSSQWRVRAEQIRTLAKEMGGISKHVMHRIAEDYEQFAQAVEQRPNRFSPRHPVVPAEVRRFAPSKNSFPSLPKIADLELPEFLKRGPAGAEKSGTSNDD